MSNISEPIQEEKIEDSKEKLDNAISTRPYETLRDERESDCNININLNTEDRVRHQEQINIQED